MQRNTKHQRKKTIRLLVEGSCCCIRTMRLIIMRHRIDFRPMRFASVERNVRLTEKEKENSVRQANNTVFAGENLQRIDTELRLIRSDHRERFELDCRIINILNMITTNRTRVTRYVLCSWQRCDIGNRFTIEIHVTHLRTIVLEYIA